MVFFAAKNRGYMTPLSPEDMESLVLREFLADKSFENLGH